MEKIRAFLRRKDIVFSAKRYFIDAMGAMAQGYEQTSVAEIAFEGGSVFIKLEPDVGSGEVLCNVEVVFVRQPQQYISLDTTV